MKKKEDKIMTNINIIKYCIDYIKSHSSFSSYYYGWISEEDLNDELLTEEFGTRVMDEVAHRAIKNVELSHCIPVGDENTTPLWYRVGIYSIRDGLPTSHIKELCKTKSISSHKRKFVEVVASCLRVEVKKVQMEYASNKTENRFIRTGPKSDLEILHDVIKDRLDLFDHDEEIAQVWKERLEEVSYPAASRIVRAVRYPRRFGYYPEKWLNPSTKYYGNTRMSFEEYVKSQNMTDDDIEIFKGQIRMFISAIVLEFENTEEKDELGFLISEIGLGRLISDKLECYGLNTVDKFVKYIQDTENPIYDMLYIKKLKQKWVEVIKDNEHLKKLIDWDSIKDISETLYINIDNHQKHGGYNKSCTYNDQVVQINTHVKIINIIINGKKYKLVEE